MQRPVTQRIIKKYMIHQLVLSQDLQQCYLQNICFYSILHIIEKLLDQKNDNIITNLS